MFRWNLSHQIYDLLNEIYLLHLDCGTVRKDKAAPLTQTYAVGGSYSLRHPWNLECLQTVPSKKNYPWMNCNAETSKQQGSWKCLRKHTIFCFSKRSYLLIRPSKSFLPSRSSQSARPISGDNSWKRQLTQCHKIYAQFSRVVEGK